MVLKAISPEAVPRALELAQRYRLLNEPGQADSICRDILAVEPDNQDAIRTLVLALTDQFGHRRGTHLSAVEEAVERLTGEYDQHYYRGVAYERWARAKLQEGGHARAATDWVKRAMECYERAEAIRPPGNDDSLLRWNACQRLLERLPQLDLAAEETEAILGD
jgi:hypothetical protein